MEPVVTARFLSVFAQLVDAGAVQKSKSMLAGKLGQIVASPVVNLVDDGLNPDGIPFPFDGEGVPSSRNIVIENGILKGFLYDTYTAAKDGVKSTGNAQRASFRALPGVGTTNFILSGTNEPEELIGDIEQGLYITDVMGMHTANPVSGDFSVGAAGIMIEGGRLTFPVRGITIAGNLGQLLKDIDAVGNDLQFFGARGASTIRIKSLSIGGK
jgi:PmbA protein